MSYAKGTQVSAERSREEIDRLLARYGADAFMYGWEGGRAVMAFRMKGRHIKFVVPMPDKSERRFKWAKVNNSQKEVLRSEEAAHRLWDQACRERWRALALVIKAKLEAVDAGISVFEDEFLANTVMPDGRTVAELTKPAIESAYASGRMQPLLPGPGA